MFCFSSFFCRYNDSNCPQVTEGAFHYAKFRSELKWKGILGITSGGGPHISVGIFRPKFAVTVFFDKPVLCFIRKFGKIKS